MNSLNRRAFLGAAGVGGLMLATGVPASAQGRAVSTVYIGSFTSWGTPPGPGFVVGSADSVSGKLTLTGGVSGIVDPSWFAYSLDGRILYSTNESATGKVTAFSLADPLRPRVLNSANVNGAGPTHVSLHGKHLLTANYSSGSVSVLSLLADGKVGAVTDVVKHTGGSRNSHAHQVVTDPSGRWIVVVDLGTDSVYVYSIDTAGKLKLNQQLVLPSGLGPRHLTFHPNGKFAYILGELRSEVTVAAWDATAGKFTPGQVISTLGGAKPPENYPGEIQISPDGRFVYASNRGHDSLATFVVGEQGKSLAFVSTTPTGGTWPRHFTLGPGGNWVYVANQNSHTINWLPRDPGTGKLGTSAGSVKVNSVGIVSFK
ncbi:lactonase family protein [Kibdelosporangium philippinense]|uniref:Lactonase family protein n=1 Tax=Kibdelosporangium philippinense TaxID=211113 RepID=A0ABS8Z4G0_9PSEU|nr:lactonase family protein [Kibdelosporangium philippinense]MCE7001839.1 lactonase family protein [Kibdelosporangium philippinense]